MLRYRDWPVHRNCTLHCGKSKGGGVGQSKSSQKEFLCWNCDKPGHNWQNCNEPLRPHLAQKQLGGTALVAERDDSPPVGKERSVGESSLAAGASLSKDDVAGMIAEAIRSARGGKNFLAAGGTENLWISGDPMGENELQGGFSFDDAYSSDGSGMGLLTSQLPQSQNHISATFVGTRRSTATIPGKAKPSGDTIAKGQQPENVQPSTSARRQLRMRDPDHDEMRALRNRLPPGLVNPADISDPGRLASLIEQTERGSYVDANTRVAQLVSLLRTCLSHAKFGALPTDLVVDTSPEAAAAWAEAQASALAGELHDRQNPRAVAWHGTIQRAVAVWLAQAQLTWSDLIDIDLRKVCNRAVTNVYGARVADHLGRGAGFLVAPPGLTMNKQAPTQLRVQSQLSLEEHRDKLAQWQQTVQWQGGRRPVVVLDGLPSRITLSGVPVKRVVLDSGANEAMVHSSIKQKLGDVVMQTDGKAITGISGQPTVMPRTQDELTVRLYTGDATKESFASSQFVVMSGDDLLDLLLDNETMALMGIRLDPVTWQATYVSQPYVADPPMYVLPLARPRHLNVTALAPSG